MSNDATAPPPVTSTFRPHDTQLIDLWTFGPMRFKVYRIISVDHLDPALLATSRRLCALVDDDEAHGLGWVTIHQTPGVSYTFANWWCQDSIVRRRGWVAPGDAPSALRPIDDEVTSCVWEIPLAAAERDAWVATMMSERPDPDGYLHADAARPVPGPSR